MKPHEKLLQDTSSYVADMEERDRLLAKIPPALVEEAKSTGRGYVFKLIRDRSRKTDRVRRDLTASKFFVEKGDELIFKRDPKIKLTVVSDKEVSVKGKGGKRIVMTFAAAQRFCNVQVLGEEQANKSPSAWQNMFLKEDPEHGMETLAMRRERMVDEKLGL